jgi:hypothetical protein
MKTYGPMKIEWQGLKSVLTHTLIAAGLSTALVVLNIISAFDFGVYTPYIASFFVFATAFIKKLLETYSVAPENSTETITEDTGAVTPIE